MDTEPSVSLFLSVTAYTNKTSDPSFCAEIFIRLQYVLLANSLNFRAIVSVLLRMWIVSVDFGECL